MPSAEASVRRERVGLKEFRVAGRTIGQANDSPGSWKRMLLASVAGAGAFHLAWTFPMASAVSLVYAWALLELNRCRSTAAAFRFGFLTGLLVFAPQLAWFWNIFGPVAICLWAVLSFFTGVFVALVRSWHAQFGVRYLWVAAPILWTGIEYFRSEWYALRFSWFSVGMLFSESGGVLGMVGVYGIGFAVFALAGFTWPRSLPSKLAALLILAAIANWPMGEPPSARRRVPVAGIQLEFPADLEVPMYLDRVLEKHPEAQILVLSEYAFDGPVPKHVREWCRKNARYLIAGGKEDVVQNGQTTFRNTAFVVDPRGEIVFQQCKSVPIQFFSDGLPARVQQVWESPWGRIAIPTCYDLSYRRVTDRFVAAGAEAFIVPFMDVTDWGEAQHRQHARIAPMRAREYAVSIFRVGSSGISQHVNSRGIVLAQADFPGQAEIIGAELELRTARLPLDRWFAPICSGAVLAFMIVRLGLVIGRRSKRGADAPPQ